MSRELIDRVEEHFRKGEWKLLEDASAELMARAEKTSLKRLAEGFLSYARARQKSEPREVIHLLEKAARSFRGVDELLYSVATTERLLLLATFDGENRGRHLKRLGEFSMNRFLRTGSGGDIRLAIEAFERARESLSGGELAEVELNLTFCYGSLAEVSDNPRGEYERVIALCDELEERYSGNPAMLARLKMNRSAALQKLAGIVPEEAPRLLQQAARHCREASDIFRGQGAHAQLVRALQGLAEVYRQASQLDKEYLEEFVRVKKEIAELFSSAGYLARGALEELEAALAEVELASGRGDMGRLKSAVREIERAGGTFRQLGNAEELAHSLAAAGVAYRSMAQMSGDAELLKRAAKSYEEALLLFQKSGDALNMLAVGAALVRVCRELAEVTGGKEWADKANALENEVRKILRKKSKI